MATTEDAALPYLLFGKSYGSFLKSKRPAWSAATLFWHSSQRATRFGELGLASTARGRLSDLTRDALDCASPESHSFAAAVIQARRCFALILLFSRLAPAAWSTAAITASVAV